MILRHELRHLEGKPADLEEKFSFEMAFFQLRHPSTWVQQLPIWVLGTRILYDKARLTLWLIAFYIFLALPISLHWPIFGLISAIGLPFYALAICYALLRSKK